jgi:hypothetical protein
MTEQGQDVFSMEHDELVEYLSSLDDINFSLFENFSTMLSDAVEEVRNKKIRRVVNECTQQR